MMFDIVYYSFPVPTNPYTVSLLGVLFDRIILPGVFLPPAGSVDKKDITERLKFLIERYNPNESFSAQREMIGTLNFLNEYESLVGSVFVPTGKQGYMGILETETEPVVMQLEELVYGPPPPNFTPTPNMGFNQPAGADQINAPSWISYPANALVYSKKHGLPLLSDSDFLPVPQIDGQVISQKEVEAMASQLMISSFSLILPKIRPLNAEDIMWTREKLADDIAFFKAAMLSAVQQLTQLIGNQPTEEQLQKQADFISKTVILPKVEALRAQFESPGSIALKKVVDLSLEAPEIALKFQKPEELPWAVVAALKAIASKVGEGLHQYQDQHSKERKSGLSLLLKVPRKFPKNK